MSDIKLFAIKQDFTQGLVGVATSLEKELQPLVEVLWVALTQG